MVTLAMIMMMVTVNVKVLVKKNDDVAVMVATMHCTNETEVITIFSLVILIAYCCSLMSLKCWSSGVSHYCH